MRSQQVSPDRVWTRPRDVIAYNYDVCYWWVTSLLLLIPPPSSWFRPCDVMHIIMTYVNDDAPPWIFNDARPAPRRPKNPGRTVPTILLIFLNFMQNLVKFMQKYLFSNDAKQPRYDSFDSQVRDIFNEVWGQWPVACEMSALEIENAYLHWLIYRIFALIDREICFKTFYSTANSKNGRPISPEQCPVRFVFVFLKHL
jgi:hypothetical protein